MPALIAILSCLTFCLFSLSPARAQSRHDDELGDESKLSSTAEPSLRVGAPPSQESYGSVSGKVVDQMGYGIAGADVTLADQESVHKVQCDDDGAFSFVQVFPGSLQLTVAAASFDTQTISGNLRSGENYVFPQITLYLATQVAEIHVSPSLQEVAEERFKDLKKQRVLGFVPNFYVSYASDTPALTSKQKFQLALTATTDPVAFLAVSVVAGVNQATNRFSGYGQGSQAYAKRYGASYANFVSGLYIGGAVLPSILKQDPRYFYQGTGTKRSRFLYAISRTVICRGDNQRWQPNYSSVFGDLAAGGISNLYIPKQDHHGARLTFENAGIALGTTAAINVLQEFVLHRFTSKRP